jgi:hypothetical protein
VEAAGGRKDCTSRTSVRVWEYRSNASLTLGLHWATPLFLSIAVAFAYHGMRLVAARVWQRHTFFAGKPGTSREDRRHR